jgi:cytidyltransferase-like protein
MVRVYTCGVFDLFHLGHLQFLQKAKTLGDYLIVGLLPDHLVQTFKRKPIIPFEQRLEIVRNIKCVDEAIEGCFTRDLTEEFYKTRHIDVHCNGDDVLTKGRIQHTRNYDQSDYAVAVRLGIMRFIPYSPATSTTEIIDRIMGNVTQL